jgi:hypothetical protein
VNLGLHVFMVPGGDVDELLHRGDLAVADIQGDRLDALAFRADYQPFDIGIVEVLSPLEGFGIRARAAMAEKL